ETHGVPLAVDQHLIEVPGCREEQRKRAGTEWRQYGCGNNEAVRLSVTPQYATNSLQVRPRVFTHEHGLSVPGKVVHEQEPEERRQNPQVRVACARRADARPKSIPLVERADRPPIAIENQTPIRATGGPEIMCIPYADTNRPLSRRP